MDLSAQTNRRTLVIMAKAPRPGSVKTRLAQSLPAPAVMELYRCLLHDTIALGRSLKGVDVALMCPESDEVELTRLLGGAVRVVAQKGEGLAAGLTSVFAHFAAQAEQRVIAFNSDSPHLASSVLEHAFQILTSSDVVVGPTHDGGYYLVGAKSSHPSLFEADGLGTNSALQNLLARTRLLGLSTGVTEYFYDIDVADDLVRLAQELRLAPARAPQTAAWLIEWGQTLAKLNPAAREL